MASAWEALSTTAKWVTPASAGLGEKVEPGAFAEGAGNDREKVSFRNLSHAFYVTGSVTEGLS